MTVVSILLDSVVSSSRHRQSNFRLDENTGKNCPDKGELILIGRPLAAPSGIFAAAHAADAHVITCNYGTSVTSATGPYTA